MANNNLQVHGDVKPVFAIDTRNGAGSETTGVPVMIQGPHLDFFAIDLGSDASSKMGVNSAVDAVIKCITQLSTVHFFQLDDDKLSIATYPIGAWSADDLQAAIRALGTVDSYSLGSADVENNGFNLSLLD